MRGQEPPNRWVELSLNGVSVWRLQRYVLFSVGAIGDVVCGLGRGIALAENPPRCGWW